MQPDERNVRPLTSASESKLFGTALVRVALVVVLLWSLVGALVAVWEKARTIDGTRDWDSFYRERVAGAFTLPSDITVVEAIYTPTPIMGERLSLAFTVPRNRHPEEFIDQVARDSGFKAQYKRSRWVWDCGRECDSWRLEYLPMRRIVRANWGWD